MTPATHSPAEVMIDVARKREATSTGKRTRAARAATIGYKYLAQLHLL